MVTSSERRQEFRSRVLSTIAGSLEGAGYRRRQGQFYTTQVNPDVEGRIGLNRVSGRAEAWIEINPMIAVRHVPLERMVAELHKEPFDPVGPGSLVVQIGYLMPGKSYRPFLFTPETDAVARAREMVDAIETYGRPFMRSYASLPALLAGMRTPGLQNALLHPERIPVAEFLLGNLDKARAELSRNVAELGERKDAAALRYRRFAENLGRRLGES